MKITVRVTSSGDCWAPEVPRIDLVACFPKGPGGERFDEAACRAQIKDCRAVLLGSDDRGAVCAERFDRDCALILADFCRAYSRKFEERGDPPLLFASETQALLEDLRARTKDEGGEKQLSKKAR